MDTESLLKSFIDDLESAKKYDRDEIIINAISFRLDKCLDSYITNLNKDLQYLKDRKQINLLRKLNR